MQRHYGTVPKGQSELAVSARDRRYGGKDRMFIKQRTGSRITSPRCGGSRSEDLLERGHSFMSYDNGPAWCAGAVALHAGTPSLGLGRVEAHPRLLRPLPHAGVNRLSD